METPKFEIDIKNIAKTTLTDSTKSAIKLVVQNSIKSSLEGKELDFERIMTLVIKETCKSVYSQTISDEVGKSLTKFLCGNNVFSNNKLGDIGIDGIDAWNKFDKAFKYGKCYKKSR